MLHSADPFVLSALIASGAATSLTVTDATTGSRDPHFAGTGRVWVAALALISTVLAISAFLVGLPKVGPATASIVSLVINAVVLAGG